MRTRSIPSCGSPLPSVPHPSEVYRRTGEDGTTIRIPEEVTREVPVVVVVVVGQGQGRGIAVDGASCAKGKTEEIARLGGPIDRGESNKEVDVVVGVTERIRQGEALAWASPGAADGGGTTTILSPLPPSPSSSSASFAG